MKVPLFDLKEQHHALEAELRGAFERVLASGHFIMGPEVEALEKECAAYLGVGHAVGVSSGTDAILLGLMALDLEPGDEVLVPSFTFFATAGCVARLGAVPVFVDVCPYCFGMDVEDAKRKISGKTRAIIPVHLFGQATPMEPFLALAKEKNLVILEDCAQSIGAKYRGKMTGVFGEFGAFSFFPTKNLGALGDGGLVVTNDARLAEKARILRMHGMQPKYYHKMIGGNFRIDALQSAFLRTKLPRLPGYAAARRANAEFYNNALSSLPGISLGASECDPKAPVPASRLILPQEYDDCYHVWNQYTLRAPTPAGANRRDAIRAALIEAGIGCEVYYPVPLHKQECFQHLPQLMLARTSGDPCPVSTRLAEEVFSLPIFPELPVEMRQYVADTLTSWLSKNL